MSTHFRGAHIRPFCSLSDLEDLLKLKANLVRYQMTDVVAGRLNCDTYKTWIRSNLNHIDEMLPLIRQYGSKLIILLNTPPAGIDTSGPKPIARMFTDSPWAKDCYKEVWQEIATRYKGETAIWALELLNEPAGTAHQTFTLQRNTAKLIHGIDSTVNCIVSPPYGNPAGFKELLKIQQPHVIYTCHFYSPLSLTHQGVYGFPAPKPYPTDKLNRSKMIEDLKPARDFQRKYKVPMYVGEYGISTYASEETRLAWFKDITSVLERYGWNNTLHSWRESEYWTVEQNTKVLDYFKGYWSKNAN